jgi:hypothetical protein
MPKVGRKHFPYTDKGRAAAEKEAKKQGLGTRTPPPRPRKNRKR